MSSVRWEFESNDEGEWAPFDPLHVRALEHAKNAEETDVTLQQGSEKEPVSLVVSLSEMTMKKTDSDDNETIVKVRRVDVAADTAKRSADETETAEQQLEKPAEKKQRATSGTAVKKAAWEKKGSVWVYRHGCEGAPERIVAFDMDDTVITTASGRTFAKDKNDWKFLCDEAPLKIKEIVENGGRVVLISNQAGLAEAKKDAKKKAGEVQAKVVSIEKALKVPIDAYLSTEKDSNRKPNTGMWDMAVSHCQFDVSTDDQRAKCLYVGDAAGRKIKTLGGKAKDFSCSDRKFAANAKIPFQTPEEFFKGAQAAKFEWGEGFNPAEPGDDVSAQIANDGRAVFHSEKQEVVMFCGPPASGKTTFAERHFIPKGYVHVNRDTLKTQAKCLNTLKKALSDGKSAVIDNTNPGKDARLPYVKLAAAAKIPIRCFYFTASLALAKHLNELRALTSSSAAHVPTIAYNIYKSKSEAPQKKEGFAEVVSINFVPQFASTDVEGVYSRFLTE